jgi:large subunit ribosomal protein L18
MAKLTKKETRRNRHYKLRKTVVGTSERPRMAVFKSNKDIYVQIIDDSKGHTIVSLSSKDLKLKNGSNVDAAIKVGTEIAKKASALKIKNIVFDRGGFLYHGRVKALADASRAEGLKF